MSGDSTRCTRCGGFNPSPIEEHCERCQTEIKSADDLRRLRELAERSASSAASSGTSAIAEMWSAIEGVDTEDTNTEEFDPTDAQRDLLGMRASGFGSVRVVDTTAGASDRDQGRLPHQPIRDRSDHVGAAKNIVTAVSLMRRAGRHPTQWAGCECGFLLTASEESCHDCGAASPHPKGPWAEKRRRRLLFGVPAAVLGIGLAVAYAAGGGVIGVAVVSALALTSLLATLPRAFRVPRHRPLLAAHESYRQRETEFKRAIADAKEILGRLSDAEETATAIRDKENRERAMSLVRDSLSEQSMLVTNARAGRAQIELGRLANVVQARLAWLQEARVSHEELVAFSTTAAACAEQLSAASRGKWLRTRSTAWKSTATMLDEMVNVVRFLSDQAAMATVLSARGSGDSESPAEHSRELSRWTERVGARLDQLSASIAAGEFDRQVLELEEADGLRASREDLAE